MLDKGIFRMEDYVEGGWVTGLKYEDEVIKDLEKRTDSKPDKLRAVRLSPGRSLVPLHLPKTFSNIGVSQIWWARAPVRALLQAAACILYASDVLMRSLRPYVVMQVGLKKYASGSPTAFGLVGKMRLAVIRAAGAIVGGSGGSP